MKTAYLNSIIRELVDIGIGIVLGIIIAMTFVLWVFGHSENMRAKCGLTVFYRFIEAIGAVQYATDI